MSIFERFRCRFVLRGGSPGHATIVTVLGLAAAGCATGEANEPEQTLQTLNAGRQTIVSSVEATGTVEPIRVIEVKSQAGGEVLDLPVELGDNVEQGTLLVRIDPRDVNNAFSQAQADLDVADITSSYYLGSGRSRGRGREREHRAAAGRQHDQSLKLQDLGGPVISSRHRAFLASR